MEHSIALVTGTTSGHGYAAASMLATKGYRQVTVTGRSLAPVQQTAAQLAAETKKQVLTPLELDLDEASTVQPSEFGTDVSGQFFAAAQGKFTGPNEEMRHAHFHDRAGQEAAWQAVVKLSGVDLL